MTEGRKRALVTGASGMLGRAICKELENYPSVEMVTLTREDCNLLSSSEVDKFFHTSKPEWVFHCAAKVGGIAANKNYPMNFLLENTTIQNNVFKAAHSENVDRLLFFASNAVYPEILDKPIKETDVLRGPPEDTVRPYAIAKLNGIELCHSFNSQFNTKYLSLIPVNLYGRNDNFHPVNSHVLPSLVQKFHKAVAEKEPYVEVWGSGKQRREFMCSDDLARIACEVISLENDKFSDLCEGYPPMLNVGVGSDISIKELAHIIAKHAGFDGEIRFDSTKPEGISRKQTCIEKMTSYGFESKISLEVGVGIIYQYYVDHIYQQK